MELTAGIDVDAVLESIKQKYKQEKINDIDGLNRITSYNVCYTKLLLFYCLLFKSTL